MTELLEIYWAVFYVGRDFAFVMVGIFATLGILRPIKLYAFAQPIIIDNEFIYSSFLLRTGWRLAVRLGFAKDDEDIRKPYGAHFYGTCIDIGVTLVGGIIFSWLWPLLIIIVVGYFPLETMHAHYARKKEFIEKLKGEFVEEEAA